MSSADSSSSRNPWRTMVWSSARNTVIFFVVDIVIVPALSCLFTTYCSPRQQPQNGVPTPEPMVPHASTIHQQPENTSHPFGKLGYPDLLLGSVYCRKV